MSALGDEGILKLIDEGVVIIHPFNRDQLNNASYDVRLGRWAYEPVLGVGVVDPTQARAEDLFRLVDMGHAGELIIPPAGFVLAHTEEFVGGTFFKELRRSGVVEMEIDQRLRFGDLAEKGGGFLGELKTKSTAARWGLDVCRAAGWGDVGFFNRWTVEIQNASPWPMVIRPGIKIGQVVFNRVSDVARESSYEVRGSYQASSELEKVMEEWVPQMMLPKKLKIA